MKKYIKSIITATLCAPMYMGVMAQTAPNIDADLTGMRAIGSPANPKVKWAWNYYMDYAGFNKLTQELAKAYPDLVKYESIGKSYQGREMYVITITDFKSGRPESKPAFWIDGNIHANELQGTQFATVSYTHLHRKWLVGCWKNIPQKYAFLFGKCNRSIHDKGLLVSD